MQNNVMEAWGISKIHRGKKVLDKVNMTVRQGDIYGLIGQNGTGKTTLIRIITGLAFPTEGEITLFGYSGQAELGAARKRIGCIIEKPVFYPNLSVEQNLEYYRIQRGIPDNKSVKNLLEKMRLSDVKEKKFQQLSLNAKQRLGLALSVMGNPDFLVLDEPVNGMDPIAIAEFCAILQNLNQNYNMTILISSPFLTKIVQLSTTCGILHEGRILKEFSKEQLEKEVRRCLSLKVDDISAAAIILTEKLHMTDFEALPGDELRIYDLIDDPSELIFHLSASKIRIKSINELDSNLEDYFIHAISDDNERPVL